MKRAYCYVGTKPLEYTLACVIGKDEETNEAISIFIKYIFIINAKVTYNVKSFNDAIITDDPDTSIPSDCDVDWDNPEITEYKVEGINIHVYDSNDKELIFPEDDEIQEKIQDTIDYFEANIEYYGAYDDEILEEADGLDLTPEG